MNTNVINLDEAAIKLIVLGIDRDINEELEIVDDQYGFDVTIEYNNEFIKRTGMSCRTNHNCTEFHWLYNKSSSNIESAKFACESDIHCIGGTEYINNVKKVSVCKSICKSEEF